MGSYAAPKHYPELIEPVPAPEFFITGTLPPSDHGDFIRIVAYAERQTEDGAGTEYVKVYTLCMPKDRYRQMMRDYYQLQRQVAAELTQPNAPAEGAPLN